MGELYVGFRPHEYTYLDGGGLHFFLRWGADGGVCRHRARECGWTIRPLNLSTARFLPASGNRNRW